MISKGIKSKSRKSKTAAEMRKRPPPKPPVKQKLNASENMSLVQLQKLAGRKGIAWGGLSKNALIGKINNYTSSSSK